MSKSSPAQVLLPALCVACPWQGGGCSCRILGGSYSCRIWEVDLAGSSIGQDMGPAHQTGALCQAW